MEYVIAIDDDDISNISPQNNHEVICIDDSEEDDDIQILDGPPLATCLPTHFPRSLGRIQSLTPRLCAENIVAANPSHQRQSSTYICASPLSPVRDVEVRHEHLDESKSVAHSFSSQVDLSLSAEDRSPLAISKPTRKVSYDLIDLDSVQLPGESRRYHRDGTDSIITGAVFQEHQQASNHRKTSPSAWKRSERRRLEEEKRRIDSLKSCAGAAWKSEESIDEEGMMIDVEDIESLDESLDAISDCRFSRESSLITTKQTVRTKKPVKVVYYPQRNPPVVAPFVCREHISIEVPDSGGSKLKALRLRPGKIVELNSGDFVSIKQIIQNTEKPAEIQIRGHLLQRTRDMNGLLEKKLNELCLRYDIDLDDPREHTEQSMVEIPVGNVIRIRNVRWTNGLWGNGQGMRNLDEDDYRQLAKARLEGKAISDLPNSPFHQGGLTLRWKFTSYFASAAARHANDLTERCLERITESDDKILDEYRVSDAKLRELWRGETILGGAWRPGVSNETLPGQAESSNLTSSIMPESTEYISAVPSSLQPAGEFSAINENLATLAKRKASSELFDAIGKRPRQERDVEGVKRQLSANNLDDGPNTTCLDNNVPKSLSSAESRSIQTTSTIIDSPESHQKTMTSPMDCSLSTSPSIDLTSPDVTSLSRITPTAQITTDSSSRPYVRSAGQTHTHGDAFCGAGGATRGAVMAGLRVLWGFDKWNSACQSWARNFPTSKLYQCPSEEFIAIASRLPPAAMKVDILHLSPPCQFFSPAHTVDGKDDEMNTASLFAVQEVIKVAKPRVVTLEQTFGILYPRFQYYFHALLRFFTSQNFSVRWAKVSLAQWGVPQRRFRLIIVASCPGEVLPRMPLPTHSDDPGSGLRPYTRVDHTLASIPRGLSHHNPTALVFADNEKADRPPYASDTILPRAMTCHGGNNYHPSGKRDFTLREYATLQGFPFNHEFEGGGKKKQIGNAVPSSVAKVLFESVRRDLDEADGIEEAPELIE